MGRLFKRSEAREAQKRVAELEEELEEARDARDAYKNVAQKITDGVRHNFDTVGNKSDAVETLDSPKIGYKATQNHIVTLLIPDGATVVHPDHNRSRDKFYKKRCDKAIVLAMNDMTVGDAPFGGVKVSGVSSDTRDKSTHNINFTYEVGEVVTPDLPLDTDTEWECTSGIHFFTTFSEAKEWWREGT